MSTSAYEELGKILTVKQLPAMPHSALSVLQLDNDLAKVNINDLVRPIEADPGLAAQVLKFLNSSYFGFQSSISNVKQGVALVGIRVVKNFVLWKAVFSLIPKSRGGGFDVAMLWQDSLRRAMFARFLLMELKKGDPEMAFAGALLQDMAIPVLLKQKPEEYAAVLTKLGASPPGVRLSKLEQDAFGWNHAQAAAVLGRTWKLPTQLIDLIESHLDIETLAGKFADKPEQAAVALAALLPIVAKEEWGDKQAFMTSCTLITPQNERLCTAVLERVDREFEQYAMILQVAKPKKLLLDYLSE